MSEFELIEAMLVAPASAVTLGGLESANRKGFRRRKQMPWSKSPRSVDPEAVKRASVWVGELELSALLTAMVSAGNGLAGSDSGWPDDIFYALRDASERRAIASAIAHHWSNALQTELSGSGQEWWFEERELDVPVVSLQASRDVEEYWVTAYEDPIWTTTAPVDHMCEQLIWGWELERVSRWSVKPASGARVFEVNGPDDWERLVRTYPLERRRRPHAGWELGHDSHEGLSNLMISLPGQRAVATNVACFVEPAWDRVAADWDAVHLTWAGYLTTEGLVIELGDGKVAMLRGWNAERTLWLNPVLEDPVPLPAPSIVVTSPEDEGVDVTTDMERQQADLQWLRARLGRDPSSDSGSSGPR